MSKLDCTLAITVVSTPHHSYRQPCRPCARDGLTRARGGDQRHAPDLACSRARTFECIYTMRTNASCILEQIVRGHKTLMTHRILDAQQEVRSSCGRSRGRFCRVLAKTLIPTYVGCQLFFVFFPLSPTEIISKY